MESLRYPHCASPMLPNHPAVAVSQADFELQSALEDSPQSIGGKVQPLYHLPMNLPFALLIPGYPLLTAFDELNGIFHIDVPAPKTIANVSFFLTQPLPDNYALALYFSTPPYLTMQYLGAIANEKPSDSFATGFPLKPELDSCDTLKFCVQLQSFEEISGLVRCEDGQKEYAKLVAHNLYNFMMSYHRQGMLVNNPDGREYLVIPSEVFTRWLKKFDEKYARDTNFIQKTTLE